MKIQNQKQNVKFNNDEVTLKRFSNFETKITKEVIFKYLKPKLNLDFEMVSFTYAMVEFVIVGQTRDDILIIF